MPKLPFAAKAALNTLAFAALAATGQAAMAEPTEITVVHQNGIGYLPIYVMADQRLIEKHAERLGVHGLKANFKNLGAPGPIRDAMLAGQAQFGAMGVPGAILLADKTKADFKALGAIVSLPMVLNTTNPAVKTICDFKDGDKIALPTVMSSVQAVTLQMAAKKYCGDAFVLDKFTISATHPDGMAQLLTGGVTAHFTSPPFFTDEIEKSHGKARSILSSYDLFGGKATFIELVGSDKWRLENPKAHEAVEAAFEEALAMINKDKEWAAGVYVRIEKPKDSLADVVKEVNSPLVEYTNVPLGTGNYAKFMKEVGTIKGDYDWKALSMPKLRSVKGS